MEKNSHWLNNSHRESPHLNLNEGDSTLFLGSQHWCFSLTNCSITTTWTGTWQTNNSRCSSFHVQYMLSKCNMETQVSWCILSHHTERVSHVEDGHECHSPDCNCFLPHTEGVLHRLEEAPVSSGLPFPDLDSWLLSPETFRTVRWRSCSSSAPWGQK